MYLGWEFQEESDWNDSMVLHLQQWQWRNTRS